MAGRVRRRAAWFGRLVHLHAPRPSRLHRHPYAETFIVLKGRVVFQVGTECREASAGQIVTVPAHVFHGFAAASEDVEMIDVHASDRFVTEWLSDPGAGTTSRPDSTL